MIENLQDGHMIDTMVKEHKHILSMLDELQNIALQLSDDDQDNGITLMHRANELAAKIIGAEPHHQREEEVLFTDNGRIRLFLDQLRLCAWSMK